MTECSAEWEDSGEDAEGGCEYDCEGGAGSESEWYVLPMLVLGLMADVTELAEFAYLEDCRISKLAAHASNPEYADRLWKLSEKLIDAKL